MRGKVTHYTHTHTHESGKEFQSRQKQEEEEEETTDDGMCVSLCKHCNNLTLSLSLSLSLSLPLKHSPRGQSKSGKRSVKVVCVEQRFSSSYNYIGKEIFEFDPFHSGKRHVTGFDRDRRHKKPTCHRRRS